LPKQKSISAGNSSSTSDLSDLKFRIVAEADFVKTFGDSRLDRTLDEFRYFKINP
jgi:hypothetical protein